MDAEVIRLGAAAKQLLDDETVMEALERIRQRHIKTMTDRITLEAEVMKARGAILAMERLIEELNGMVADGEFEKRKQ